MNNKLPLLLSKDAMKKTDTPIDFTKDKNDQHSRTRNMDMKFHSSGHYLKPISKSYETLNEFDENNTKSTLSIENVRSRTLREKQRKITEKLHTQFELASSNKM